MPAKCNVSECVYSEDCTFLDIIGVHKLPRNKNTCSYYRKQRKQIEEVNMDYKKESKDE